MDTGTARSGRGTEFLQQKVGVLGQHLEHAGWALVVRHSTEVGRAMVRRIGEMAERRFPETAH